MLEIYLKLSEQIVVDVLMNQAATGEVMYIGIQGCPAEPEIFLHSS